MVLLWGIDSPIWEVGSMGIFKKAPATPAELRKAARRGQMTGRQAEQYARDQAAPKSPAKRALAARKAANRRGGRR